MGNRSSQQLKQSATEAVSKKRSRDATLFQLPSPPLPGVCFSSTASDSRPKGKTQPSNDKGWRQDRSAAATGLLREDGPVRRVLCLHGLRPLPQQLRQQDSVVLFRWS